MVSFYRLSQRRIPAFIAIMAILLLFIAPDVSKSLEHQRVSTPDASAREDHSSMVSMHHGDMSGMTMDEMATLHSAPPSMATTPPSDYAQHHAMPAGMGMMDDVACGYCQLLAHFPVLLIVFIPLVWLLYRLTLRMPPSRYESWLPSAFFPGIVQPRAPPVFPSSL
ncbi:DUF2946 domain-containing protein [Erwinia rhapontici]|uniref:DUF2946 domain-containing protein n=1 Tax=Erwinia rhapontici TaxID=55212 RepID=UPI0010DAD04F|nr:DUF2946 domain-containing protein [Erwinia rhapontici]TDT02413.1 DUF2946 family protein [Erwinia rhapontici]